MKKYIKFSKAYGLIETDKLYPLITEDENCFYIRICNDVTQPLWRIYKENSVYQFEIINPEEITIAATEEEKDNINPDHYKKGNIECIDAIMSATGEGFNAYCVGNIIKYLWRFEHKNGLEDVKKARWYLEKLINNMEKE